MSDAVKISGIALASLVARSGIAKASIVKLSGNTVPAGFGTLYVTGFYFEGSPPSPDPVELAFDGFVGGSPRWSAGPNNSMAIISSWWAYYYNGLYAFEGAFGSSPNDPTGALIWMYQTPFEDRGFTCYFNLP